MKPVVNECKQKKVYCNNNNNTIYDNNENPPVV